MRKRSSVRERSSSPFATGGHIREKSALLQQQQQQQQRKEVLHVLFSATQTTSTTTSTPQTSSLPFSSSAKESSIPVEETTTVDDTLAPLEVSLSIGRALKNFVRLSATYWVNPQHNPLEHFTEEPPIGGIGPTRRILFFLFMGFFLSIFALWVTEDEFFTGPKLNKELMEVADFYPVHISFSNLSCGVGEKQILSRVSGDARPGRLMAILGSSGSGKTTLAHALLGRSRRSCSISSGTVFLNGIPGSLDSFLDRVGFVPQDDVLYAEMTVLETIQFAAKARLPRYFTSEQIDRQVQETLETLDLVKVQHTMVGNTLMKTLSGGERKRVSIGMELVTLPSVLVLDEPTSGLDGYQSHKLIGTLKLIADRYNVSVVAVVHQPSSRSFALFDDLILLQLGKLVYFGERSRALEYFSSLPSLHEYFSTEHSRSEELNDAEILLDITTGFTHLMEDFTLPASVLREQESSNNNNNNALVERCSGYRFDLLRTLCNIQSGFLISHDDYAVRPKRGIIDQTYQWWVLLWTLSLRRGMMVEIASIFMLAFICAFLRHFNRTWHRKQVASFYISVSIGMLAMMGAVLEDDILPVRRAVHSGMLLGAHEFALVLHSLNKGFLITHFFSLVYFAWRYAFDPPPSCEDKTREFVCTPFSLRVYLRFHHLITINYYCARGFGLLVNVLVDHNEKKSMVVCCALLIGCHCFSLFSPQFSQLSKDGVFVFGHNLAGFVIKASSLSYVRYFLEAMYLWDPDETDKVGRDFTMRYYSYHDGTEAACANTIVGFIILSQIVRFILFSFRNASDYASVHDAPAFIFFLVKILTVYCFLLVFTLFYNEFDAIRGAWNASVTKALETTRQNRRLESRRTSLVLGTTTTIVQPLPETVPPFSSVEEVHPS